MKNNYRNMCEDLTGDAVIQRGYDIYDMWEEKKFSSKKIVSYVNYELSLLKEKKTNSQKIELLSCLFALDLRIKERYKSFIRCLVSYFSWSRETRALLSLKQALHISLSENDTRAIIELELEKIRENFGAEDVDEDDETSGGKRNGKSEEEAVSREEKSEDAPEQDSKEESLENEEKEEALEVNEEAPQNEPAEERQAESSPQEEAEAPLNEAEKEDPDSRKDAQKEEARETKEENNSPTEEAEPTQNKRKEEASKNLSELDFAPLYDEPSKDDSKEKISFIDEVIMDNMVKGKDDIVGHNPLEDVRNEREARESLDIKLDQNGDLDDDMDSFLYDQKELNENGKLVNGQENQAGSATEESADSRMKIQVDMSKENGGVDEGMREKEIREYKSNIEKAAREQMEIESAEFGIEAPVELIGEEKTQKVASPVLTKDRK